ncbi:MAG: CpaE family protein [Capsulimonadaceae bacterium]
MIRVLVADSNPPNREQLRAFLATDSEIEIVSLARDGQEALQMAHQYRPDIAILAADLSVQDGFQTAEYLAGVGYLPTQTIILSDSGAEDHLRRAMRAGAREHITRPVVRTALLKAVHDVYDEEQRRHSPAFVQAADPKKTTRLIAVSGAKGGIGKTTLVTNLAVAMAQETGEPTVLIDLYVQFGDVGMLLNTAPRRTLAELASLDPSEVDFQLVQDCMVQHESGLNVLFSSKTPVALDAITVACIENVIGQLKLHYRYVLIDVPPILHTTTLYVLAHASTVLLVANLYDLTTINDTRQLLSTIQGKYVAREKISVVLNRVSRQNRLPLSEIEQTLGHPISAQIPNDGVVVPTSINQGVPFVVSQPNTAVAQSIRQLARTLAGIGNIEKTMMLSADDLARPKRGFFFGG